jgi:hypothetical protein
LLISSDFLASDYCNNIEVRRALERHEAGEVRIIPVLLREVDWAATPLSRFQALPTKAVPVTSARWSNRDEAFTDVARGIRAVIEMMNAERAGVRRSIGAPKPPSQATEEEDGKSEHAEGSSLRVSSLGFTLSSVEYYCYISQSKVSQLYSQLALSPAHSEDFAQRDTKRIVELRKRLHLVRTETESKRALEELKELVRLSSPETQHCRLSKFNGGNR